MHYSRAQRVRKQMQRQYAKILNRDFLAFKMVDSSTAWISIAYSWKAWKKLNVIFFFFKWGKEGNLFAKVLDVQSGALHPTSRYSLIANAKIYTYRNETMQKYSYNKQIESKTKTLTTTTTTVTNRRSVLNLRDWKI